LLEQMGQNDAPGMREARHRPGQNDHAIGVHRTTRSSDGGMIGFAGSRSIGGHETGMMPRLSSPSSVLDICPPAADRQTPSYTVHAMNVKPDIHRKNAAVH
jgi:hypothetical protein